MRRWGHLEQPPVELATQEAEDAPMDDQGGDDVDISGEGAQPVGDEGRGASGSSLRRRRS